MCKAALDLTFKLYRKAKLLDEDDGDIEPVVAGMKPSVSWKVPALLPENPDVPKPQLNSNEVATQIERMKTAVAAQYFSDSNVPSSPTPLSDIEQALDMTAQSAATVAKLPFFASHQQESTTPEASNNLLQQTQSDYAVPPPQPAAPSGATIEFVQALGLPLFLVGQDTKALQTLASSPGLLNSLVDSTGMYDQGRLLSLVQTLSGTPAPAPTTVVPPPQYPPQAPPQVANPYGSGGFPPYANNSFGASRHNNVRKSDEGNLHVSGYGPMTTQADLIALFSQYVVVDEVVMKGSFAFVNTSDPFNAQRAREALTGTLVGGQPLRINPAQRKARDSNASSARLGSTYGVSSYNQPAATKSPGFPFSGQVIPANQPPPPPPASFQPQPTGIDHVRDSRGNAPTKNLFVAGKMIPDFCLY